MVGEPRRGPLCELRFAPDAVHRDATEIESDVHRWAVAAGLVPMEARSQRIPRLAARMLPHRSRAEVELLARWYFVLLHLDDRCDSDSQTPDQIRGVYEDLDRVIAGPPVRGEVEPVVAAVGELWRGTSAPMSVHWRRRFRSNLLRHGQALTWEARRRERPAAPTPARYHDLRMWSNGLFIWDLLEPALGVELPVVVAESLTWQLVIASSCDISAWRNDIVSAWRERSAGHVENAVLTHMRTYDVSEPEAIDVVEGWIADRCADLLRYEEVAIEEAASLSGEHRSVVLVITSAVRGCLAGHVRWLLESDRYRREAE